ncbi:MAG: hypothetical protein KBT04_06420 [Bacteroidales bacterium]|nr:hypothetical protein [Candidatus Colimorpha onthohippi]
MKKIFAYLLTVVAMTSTINAQMLESNDMIYHSKNIPQTNLLNPAFFPENRNCFVALPNFNFGFGMPIAYSDLQWRYNDNQQRYNLDLNALAQTLDDNPSFHLNTTVNLLGFGFRHNNWFASVNIGVVSNMALYFPSGLSEIMNNGLINRIGPDNTIEINCDELFFAQAYEKITLGFGMQINEHLTAGAHVNILNGLQNINTDQTKITIYAKDDAFSTLYGDIQYRLARSGIVDYDYYNSTVDYNIGATNMGVTFDLGAAYKTGNWEFSASLIDFGPGIHWSTNVKETTNKHSQIAFSGTNIDSMMSNGEYRSNFANEISDTLAELFRVTDQDADDYWHGTPTRLYLGASYRFNKIIRANLLFHGEWDKGIRAISKGHFRCNTSLSASFTVTNWLDIRIADAISFDGSKGAFFNPGAGITLTPGNAVQMYVMADYLSSIYAVDFKSFYIQTGLNIFFGTNLLKQKKDISHSGNNSIIITPATNDPTNANGSQPASTTTGSSTIDATGANGVQPISTTTGKSNIDATGANGIKPVSTTSGSTNADPTKAKPQNNFF